MSSPSSSSEGDNIGLQRGTGEDIVEEKKLPFVGSKYADESHLIQDLQDKVKHELKQELSMGEAIDLLQKNNKDVSVCYDILRRRYEEEKDKKQSGQGSSQEVYQGIYGDGFSPFQSHRNSSSVSEPKRSKSNRSSSSSRPRGEQGAKSKQYQTIQKPPNQEEDKRVKEVSNRLKLAGHISVKYEFILEILREKRWDANKCYDYFIEVLSHSQN